MIDHYGKIARENIPEHAYHASLWAVRSYPGIMKAIADPMTSPERREVCKQKKSIIDTAALVIPAEHRQPIIDLIVNRDQSSIGKELEEYRIRFLFRIARDICVI